jgi:hypothetical protein
MKNCTDTNNVLGDSLHTHPISRPLPLKVLACKALFPCRQAQIQAIITQTYNSSYYINSFPFV